MEKYNLVHDLKAFGFQVKTFPDGIGEAFDKLAGMLKPEHERAYFGISEFANDGTIIYKAAAIQNFEGEAEKYGCESYTIEKGEYLTETIKDWYDKTGSIKDVFGRLLNDKHVDKTKPCIEWYKTMDEMLCMVKLKH